MKRPAFIEGVAVALVASLAGGAAFAGLTTLLAGGLALRLLVAGLGLCYVIYLLRRSGVRIGRVTVVAAWLAAAVLAWVSDVPLSLYLLAHIGLVWLVRSLYFHAGVLPALADLGLNGLALAAAVWAAVQTGSVALGLWCLFLTQALFVVIPADLRRRPGPAVTRGEDRFSRAHRAAQTALRRLSLGSP